MSMILKLSIKHWESLYITDDPGFTLTYFTAMPNWVPYVFEWGKLLHSHLTGKKKLAPNDQIVDKNLTSGLPLPRDYIHVHVYDHYFQTSSLKPLGQLKPNFMWSLLGKGDMNLLKWS